MTATSHAGKAAPRAGAALPRHAYAPGDSLDALCGAELVNSEPWLIGTGEPTCPDCWAAIHACRCYSCDHQCGGTDGPGSCGPVADVDGRLICQACREKADVFDNQRAGALVTLDQDAIRLQPDVFSHVGTYSLWLDARSARHLAELLHRRAAELDIAEAEAAADEEAGR